IAALKAAQQGITALMPIDEFGQPFPTLTNYRERMIKEVDKHLSDLEALENKVWVKLALVMSHEGWSNAKAQAVSLGMVNVETGIKLAFQEMRKAEKEYHAAKDGTTLQVYVDAIDHVIDCFKKFGPIDDFGKPFQPMVNYRDQMIAALT